MDTGTWLLAGLGGLSLLLALRALINRSRMNPEQLMELQQNGALVLDVRTPQEFGQGHAPGSRNVPLDRLSEQIGGLDKGKPVVVCCASGARSAAAKRILEQAGFAEVHNAGPWQRLLQA